MIFRVEKKSPPVVLQDQGWPPPAFQGARSQSCHKNSRTHVIAAVILVTVNVMADVTVVKCANKSVTVLMPFDTTRYPL